MWLPVQEAQPNFPTSWKLGTMCLNRLEKAKGSKISVMHFIRNRDQRLGSFIVEAPILMRTPLTIYRVPKFQLSWDWNLIKLGLNFNQVRTNSAMTHVQLLQMYTCYFQTLTILHFNFRNCFTLFMHPHCHVCHTRLHTYWTNTVTKQTMKAFNETNTNKSIHPYW